MTVLDPDLVDAVLEALGLRTAPAADLDGLTSLYAAWCGHVPFDNVRKLIALHEGHAGALPGDDPTDFLASWLAHRVGGTCWAGNGALCALLEALGFDARRGVATMLVAPDIPPNHGTVVVELPEGRFVTDASIMTVQPLAVAPGAMSRVDHPAWGVTGEWSGGAFAIRWQPMLRADRIHCRIDEWSVDPQRFRAQHELTRGWSPFNYELTFNLVRDDGRLGAANGQRVRIEPDGTLQATPIADRLTFLVTELGISEELARRLPADTATPPPPGSRTAAAVA